MLVNLCGNFHVQKNKNNQDYFFYNEKVKIAIDGCSLGDEFDSSNTEVGAKLFSSLFSQINPKLRDDPKMFEKNVYYIFSKLLNLFDSKFGETDKTKIEYLIKFFSFTIIACFELDDGFIVKTMGDGYIIMINKDNQISYFKLDYDNSPPYYIYNCIQMDNLNDKISFETYRFSKEHFNNIGVSTDGISIFASEFALPKSEILKIDKFLLNKDNLPEINANSRIVSTINKNKSIFFDDVTLII